jgi:hypothetical protein
MSNNDFLLLEETRANFFQIENWMSNLDTKAFGLSTINALLFSLFAYILILFQENIPLALYLPPVLLILSLIFLILCAWPQYWRRQSGKATIEHYESLEPETAARQLAANYSTWECELLKKYWNKFRFFKIGLILTMAAFVSEIIIFFFSY